MTEEQTPDVVEEVVAPVQEAETQEAPQPPQEDPQERNWREMRNALKELQRQNHELKSELTQRSAPPPIQEKDELDDIPDDDYLTKKQAVKLASKLANKLAEERATEVVKRREAESIPNTLRTKFSDYDSVVSKENLELLMQTEPELAKSLYALKDDPLAQGIAAYKLLKKQDFTQEKQTYMDKAKAVNNSKKPSVSTAVTKGSALAEANRFANGLTPELKAALWKEMKEAARAG